MSHSKKTPIRKTVGPNEDERYMYLFIVTLKKITS